MNPLGRILLASGLLLAFVGHAFAPPAERPPDAIIKPHPGDPFPDGSPGRGDRQLPPFLRQQDTTLGTLRNALGRGDPDIAEIKAALDAVVAASLDTPILELSAMLAAAKGDPVQMTLGPDTPNILVQHPSNAAYRPVVDYLTKHVKTSLQAQVDRDSVRLLPLTFSSEAKAKLDSDIPLAWRARGDFIDDIIAGDFETLDARMFSSLRGETVVVVGHVVIADGKPAFEIRRSDGGRRYLPLDALARVQRTAGVNFIPLGCETGQSAAIGTATKINDVDALDAFKNAKQKSGISSYEGLLADLSSPRIRILINLSKLSDNFIIPYDLVDEKDQVFRAYPNGAAFGGPPPSQSLFQVTPGASAGGGAAGTVSRSTLARSIWLAAKRPSLEDWWFWIYYGLVAIGVVGTLAELPFRHALTIRSRVSAAISLPLAGIVVAIVAGMFLDGWLTTPSVTGGVIFVPLIVWGILAQLKDKFPDHRVAIMATRAVVIWCLVPLIVKLLVFGAERMNWLIEPSPITAALNGFTVL